MSCDTCDEKVTRWDEKVAIWDEMGRKWDGMGRKWDVNVTRWDEKQRDGILPSLLLFIFIHKHYLFYVAAFSATFKLLKTKFLILATHCTNKSKNTAI